MTQENGESPNELVEVGPTCMLVARLEIVKKRVMLTQIDSIQAFRDLARYVGLSSLPPSIHLFHGQVLPPETSPRG